MYIMCSLKCFIVEMDIYSVLPWRDVKINHFFKYASHTYSLNFRCVNQYPFRLRG